MVRLLHEAQASKAPIVKIADRFARWFSPVIIVIAGLTYFLTDDFTRTLTILVVACPCSLCVATPTAIAAGIGAGARRGLLIKSGRAVETLGRVDAVLFDKTGTLTVGELTLSKILTVPGEPISVDDLVKLAAAAEGASPHPIAQALRRRAAGADAVSKSVASFRSLPGGGVSAEVGVRSVLVGPQQILQRAGIAYRADAQDLWSKASADGAVSTGIAIDGRLAAVLIFTDGPRPGLDSLMKELRATGVRHLATFGKSKKQKVELRGTGHLTPMDAKKIKECLPYTR
jgi:P-type E1-E2 ATPase